MRRLLAIVTVLIGMAPSLGRAQDAFDTATTVARLDQSFGSWLEARDLKGVLAIRRGETAFDTGGHGLQRRTKVELASVSKSITGVCAAELVGAKKMRWSDTVADVVGRGPDITLGDLITHSGGIREDSTQGMMLQMLDKKTDHQSTVVLDAVIARNGPKGARGSYQYSNENYALAALMIEAATGRAYKDICRDYALKPAGVSASPSKRSGAFLPWGGWSMRAADYAKFHAHWFSDAHRPKALPHTDAGYGVNYGMGTFFREMGRGTNYWHFGALCFPGRLNTGSFAVTWFGDWTVVAAYDGCVSWDDMVALDNSLSAAVFGARK